MNSPTARDVQESIEAWADLHGITIAEATEDLANMARAAGPEAVERFDTWARENAPEFEGILDAKQKGVDES